MNRWVVNKNALLQNTLIYLSMQYFGGRIATALGNDTFFSIIFVITAVLFLTHRGWFERGNGKVNEYIFYCIIMLAYLLFEFVNTSGGMTMGTILSLLLRFMIIYLSIRVDPDSYLTRLVKMIIVFAIIGNVIYFSHFIGLSPVWTALSKFFYKIKSDSWIVGDTYGLFLIVFKITDLQRNSYMFGEPGEYQMIVNTAIYYLLYYGNTIKITHKNGSVLILLITLLTIQSTSGFISLIVIALGALLQSKKQMEEKTRRMLFFAVILSIIYCVFFASKDSILYTSFINKIFSDSGKVDLMQGTATDRSMPFVALAEILKSNPLQAILGVGPNGLSNTLIRGYTANGFVNSIMMFGLAFIIPVYIYMIIKNMRYSNNLISGFTAIFVVFNQAFGQPEMLSVFSILVLMYPYIISISKKEDAAELFWN